MAELRYCNALVCGQGEPQFVINFQLFTEKDKLSNTQIQNENTRNDSSQRQCLISLTRPRPLMAHQPATSTTQILYYSMHSSFLHFLKPVYFFTIFFSLLIMCTAICFTVLKSKKNVALILGRSWNALMSLQYISIRRTDLI